MLVTCPNSGLFTAVTNPPSVERLNALMNSARNWKRTFSRIRVLY